MELLDAASSSWSGRESGTSIILIVICLTPLLLMAHVKGDSVRAQFLKSNFRFKNSTFVDSYFCCNVCGGRMQWLVNGDDAGVHLATDRAGSVSYQTEGGDSTTLRYTSMVLSTRTADADICLDVVLLVTQLESEYRLRPPVVLCRSPTQEYAVSYPENVELEPDQKINGSVTLNYILGRSNIVSPGNNFVTHIFLCNTNEVSQFWLLNRKSAGGFNGIHTVGDSEFTLHSNDTSISFQETVLLVKHEHVNLTSVLVLTDFNSSNDFTVSCVSNSNYAFTVMNDSYLNSGNDLNPHPAISTIETATDLSTVANLLSEKPTLTIEALTGDKYTKGGLCVDQSYIHGQ